MYMKKIYVKICLLKNYQQMLGAVVRHIALLMRKCKFEHFGRHCWEELL